MILLEGLIVVIVLQLIFIWHQHWYTNSSIEYQRGRHVYQHAPIEEQDVKAMEPVMSDADIPPSDHHISNRIPVDYVSDPQLTSAIGLNEPKFNTSRFSNNQPGNFIQDGQQRPVVFG